MTPNTEKHRINFFTTEDGEPWAVFAWGEVPASIFTVEGCCVAVCYDGGWDRADALELIGLGIDPVPLWIKQNGNDEDYNYVWCRRDDPDALRITGARF